MSDVIVVALITGLCSVIGQWLIARGQSNQKKSDDAARDARIEARLTSVEKKLDIHNGYAEKFSEIGADIAVIKNDIRTLYNQKG